MTGILGDIITATWHGGDVLSAANLNRLRSSVLHLDAVTRMPLSVFCTCSMQFPWLWQRNPIMIWRGAVTWRSSATTLTAVVEWTGSVLSGDRVRFVINGTNHDMTPVTGVNTFTFSLSFPDLTVVRIDVILRSTSRGPGGFPNPSPEWPDVFVREISISPIAPSTTYPTSTAFGALTEARLTDITRQIAWLQTAYGMHIRPINPMIHRVIGNLTGWIGRIRWLGSFIRPSTHTSLRVTGVVVVRQTGQTESIDVLVNGTLLASWSIPTTVGVHPFTITASIASIPANTRATIDIRQTKTAPAGTVSPNYVTLHDVVMTAASASPPTLTEWTARESVSFSTLQTRLNQLRNAVAAIHTTYTATTAYWQRQYAAPTRFAKDEDIFEYYEPAQPLTTYRLGEVLIVRGESATIARGAISYEQPPENKVVDWKAAHETSLIGGEGEQTVMKYLDQLPFVPVGSLYYLKGKRIYYAAEWLGAV